MVYTLEITSIDEDEGKKNHQKSWLVLKTLADFHSLHTLLVKPSLEDVDDSGVGYRGTNYCSAPLPPSRSPISFLATSGRILDHSKQLVRYCRSLLSITPMSPHVKSFFNLEVMNDELSRCGGNDDITGGGKAIKEGVIEVCTGCMNIKTAKNWKRR